MYRLEWIEQIKLARRNGSATGSGHTGARAPVSPVVVSLGFTSLLTDISSEMVNSILPVYLVRHLHLSPIQYGVIDGVYNGFAIALLSLLAGYLADRAARHKEVAIAGYGFSAICKLLLLAAGTTWAWLLIIIGLDRAGKGIRAAPRDALISLNTPSASLASAFSVHRAMDACGSLLGPIVAFVLLARLPGAFDAVWVTSFVFAVLGIAVLWLFVPVPTMPHTPIAVDSVAMGARWRPWKAPRLLTLAGCGALLAATTISDGFLYLMMQEKSAVASGFFPLFYVLTAAAYMFISIPAGRMADSFGRAALFLTGYVLMILVYGALLSMDKISAPALIGCLLLLGAYYACTEGVLMAMSSAVIPAEHRTIGIATVATSIAMAKLLSSVLFGWLWQSFGMRVAVIFFIFALGVALLVTFLRLRTTHR